MRFEYIKQNKDILLADASDFSMCSEAPQMLTRNTQNIFNINKVTAKPDRDEFDDLVGGPIPSKTSLFFRPIGYFFQNILALIKACWFPIKFMVVSAIAIALKK